MKTTRLLTVIAILQGLALVSQWRNADGASQALAGNTLPDPGADRRETIAELKTLNGKMDSLIKLLESGKVQVEVITPDDKKK
jgi:hypothetical protein